MYTPYYWLVEIPQEEVDLAELLEDLCFKSNCWLGSNENTISGEYDFEVNNDVIKPAQDGLWQIEGMFDDADFYVDENLDDEEQVAEFFIKAVKSVFHKQNNKKEFTNKELNTLINISIDYFEKRISLISLTLKEQLEIYIKILNILNEKTYILETINDPKKSYPIYCIIPEKYKGRLDDIKALVFENGYTFSFYEGDKNRGEEFEDEYLFSAYTNLTDEQELKVWAVKKLKEKMNINCFINDIDRIETR